MPHSDRTTLSKVPHDSYRHEAFLWSGEDDFLAGTAPFIRQTLGGAFEVKKTYVVPSTTLGSTLIYAALA